MIGAASQGCVQPAGRWLCGAGCSAGVSCRVTRGQVAPAAGGSYGDALSDSPDFCRIGGASSHGMGWDGMDGSMAGSSLMAVGRQHLESTTIES